MYVSSKKLKREKEFNQERREEERKLIKEKEHQIMCGVKKDAQDRYGFIPDLGVSTFKNVCRVIHWQYDLLVLFLMF